MISVGLIGVGKIAKTFHLPAWEQVDGARVLALVCLLYTSPSPRDNR